MARAAVLVITALAGCTDGASPELGLGALLHVEGAQLRPGPVPTDEGGPAALSLSTGSAQIPIGRIGATLRGVLEPTARAAVVGIAGEPEAWLLPAGVAELDTPGLPSARAAFSLGDAFPPGPFTLVLAAADASGRFGASTEITLIADELPPPEGELVIGLAWSGPADLDLHVVDPAGGEAWSDKPTTMPPPTPGEPVDPAAYLQYGILDQDGNQDCRRDGRPREHVIWTVPPPAGTYTIRVDARSLCGAPSAAFYVAAYRSGALLGAARGVATPADVLHPHGAGAGVLALRFAL